MNSWFARASDGNRDTDRADPDACVRQRYSPPWGLMLLAGDMKHVTGDHPL
jgi:hypothetical protein